MTFRQGSVGTRRHTLLPECSHTLCVQRVVGVSLYKSINKFILLKCNKGEERKTVHQESTPDLHLCNLGVPIFLSLYVCTKIFTPVGLMIASEENGAQAVSGSTILKITHEERNGKF